MIVNNVTILHLQLFIKVLATGIAIFGIDITTVLLSLCVVIDIVAFGTNDVIILLLSTPGTGRAGITDIIIKESDINKMMTLLSVCINIITPWLFMLIIETEISVITVKVAIFNMNNMMILLSILL